MDEIENINGIGSIESGLCTNFSKGLKGDDLRERDVLFGNNQKPIIPPKTYLQLLM